MDKKTIRRNILSRLNDVYPAPMDNDDILNQIYLVNKEQKEELLKELNTLEAYSYVENLQKGAREPLWRITAAGIEQISREAKILDDKIWGKLAY